MAIVRKIYFAISPDTNREKLEVLETLASEWKQSLPLVFSWYWKIFLNEGIFMPVGDPRVAGKGTKKTIPDIKLVTSMRQTMVKALHGLCTSWSANASNAWSKTLSKHLDAVLKGNANAAAIRHQVLWINKCQRWCQSNIVVKAKWMIYSKKFKGTPILWDPQSLVIARTWFDDQLHRGKRKKPSPQGIPLTFHEKSFRWIDNPQAKTKWERLHTHAWANISTTGKRLLLPVMFNAYWNKRSANATKIHKTATLEKRGSRWYLGRTFEMAQKILPKHALSIDTIGVDMGMHHRIATSHGDLYGSGWMEKVKQWDTKLLALQQRLQKSGVKRLSQSKQYRNLIQRFRASTEYGIQHALNRIISIYTPDTVVIEDLDLKNMQEHVSKPMARRLARLGTGVLKRHLALKAEEHGFAVEIVDPSYTSQMCHACGYTDNKNRVGDAFACQKCGYCDHADLHAAKNIKECFLDPTLKPTSASGKRTKSQLQARWIARQQAASIATGQGPCVIGHAPPRVSTQTSPNALPCLGVISNALVGNGMLKTVVKKQKFVKTRAKKLHKDSTQISG